MGKLCFMFKLTGLYFIKGQWYYYTRQERVGANTISDYSWQVNSPATDKMNEGNFAK